MTKTLRGVFVGYVQHAGGGWAGDVDLIDALDLTNAMLSEEDHVERISANEILSEKDARGESLSPYYQKNGSSQLIVETR